MGEKSSESNRASGETTAAAVTAGNDDEGASVELGLDPAAAAAEAEAAAADEDVMIDLISVSIQISREMLQIL